MYSHAESFLLNSQKNWYETKTININLSIQSILVFLGGTANQIEFFLKATNPISVSVYFQMKCLLRYWKCIINIWKYEETKLMVFRVTRKPNYKHLHTYSNHKSILKKNLPIVYIYHKCSRYCLIFRKLKKFLFWLPFRKPLWCSKFYLVLKLACDLNWEQINFF